jgi:cysteine desulfurase/selenocysteine lyase
LLIHLPVNLDIPAIRADFPILSEKIYQKPLIYFDNAATTQKPRQVIDAISHFYQTRYSNIHRGVHHLSELATDSFESARDTVRDFVGAEKRSEIVFTAGATAAINLVAHSFSQAFISEGDEILVSEMEHHANIVPWQLVAARTGAILKVIPMDDSGSLQIDLLPGLLTDKTRILAITQVSNALGTINPIREIIRLAHERNIPVLVDGAQSIQHERVNVQELDCDFFVFSGHKVYGPTGIGILYGKENWLDRMPPYQGGGDMIESVSFEKTTFNELPFKFEAGTMNFVGAHGLAVALEYLNHLGIEHISSYEQILLQHATKGLLEIPGLRIIGTAANKGPVISFLPGNVHPYDAGMILDKMGIAVRTGTHCAQPVMDHFGISGTIRASFCFYNTHSEIDQLVLSIRDIIRMFE